MSRRVAVAALAAALAVAAGCGERSFDAPEFVAAANERGATLVLGEPLPNDQEGVSVHELRFEGAEPAATVEPGAPPPQDAHGGGSLLVAEDEETAEAEFARCQGAVSLVCYRAANVVLFLEGAIPPSDRENVDRAIRAMASD